MTRICVVITLVFWWATYLYGDPGEDAKRVELFHSRLQTIGIGNNTSIRVLLRDGETLRGMIDYLGATEVGIRDEFDHLRPVPLAGIVDFAARNETTGVRTASANRWRRATRLLWRRINGSGFDGLVPPGEVARFAIIEMIHGRGAIV